MEETQVSGPLIPQGIAIQRVLVVDDSRLQRHLTKGILTRMGIEVLEAVSGEAALDLLANEHVDMILSDWMMDGMTGLEFCRRFRARQGESYVYFVLTTSKSEREALTEGLIQGADDFLTKPINGEELRARTLAADRIISTDRLLNERNRDLATANAELERAKDALERDLIEARRLQQALVPRQPVALERATMSFLFQPSGHVGGDLVGRIPITDTRFGLYSVDVSGHGVAAAMITARLGATLGSGSPDQNVALEKAPEGLRLREPSEICARLNAQFMEEVDTDHYFTLAVADVDLTTGVVRISQAGHPCPLLQRAGGSVSFLGEGGLPVGLIDGADYESFSVTLAPGDRLFLYSDGITECPDPSGGMLEEEGLARIFHESADLKGMKLLDLLNWRLNQLSETDALPDDVSGILLEMT